MKTRALSFFMITTLAVMLTSSCGKIKELSAFDVSYTLPRTTFIYTPSTFKSGEQLLYSGYFNANLDSILNANGFSSGLISQATVTSCNITIVQPSDVTFSWLQTARAEVSPNPDFNPSELVATAQNIDPQNKTVNLTTYNTNIRPYLGNTAFYFRIYGVLNGPVPAEWVQMYVDGTLLMHLEPL